MNGHGTSAVPLLIFLALIAWRVYVRFKRMVGRQRLSRVRPWITLAIFPLLVGLLAAAALGQPARLAWLAAGLAIGAVLGVFGLRKTHFEPTREGLFYTPNAHLGIALSLLLAGRIAYRLADLFLIHPDAPRGVRDFAGSVPTLAVFGVLAGYYIVYAAGLVRWRGRVLRAKRDREARARASAAAPPAAPQ
jgi:hypothetical protein